MRCALVALLACARAAEAGLLLVHNGTIIVSAVDAAGRTADPPVRAATLCVEAGDDARGRVQAASRCDGGGADVRYYDLAGAVVLPGLWDAHGHVVAEGERLRTPWLFNASDEAAAVGAVADFVALHPVAAGDWVVGGGWDQTQWPGQQYPTKASLDAAFPDTPVVLDRYDGHATWVNSAALAQRPPLPDADPEGGVIVRDPATGEPTGVLVDNARALVAPPTPSAAAQDEWLGAALAELAAAGVTAVSDMGSSPETIDQFGAWADAGRLSARLDARYLGIAEEGMGGAADPLTAKRMRLAGPNMTLTVGGVKFFADGALGSWGAAMLAPYDDLPNATGTLRLTPEAFLGNATAWAARGWQLATHAIGDAANRLVLDTYEAVAAAVPGARARRPRVEHAQLVNCTDLPRFAALGVLASMQPTHCSEDLKIAEQRIGPERCACGAYAWASMLASGAPALPFGSDFPVEPVSPFDGMYAAVTREVFYGPDLGTPEGGWYPAERVSRAQALRGFTYDAAYAANLEAELGSLDEGKLADFVVVDRDPTTVTPDEAILETRVLATFLGGKRVFDAAAERAAAPEGPPVEPHSAIPDDR
jgi:predicted amidohydrolase YtcJ